MSNPYCQRIRIELRHLVNIPQQSPGTHSLRKCQRGRSGTSLQTLSQKDSQPLFLFPSHSTVDAMQPGVGRRFAGEGGSARHLHLALAILHHASRTCLGLHRLSDKSSWIFLHELIQAVKQYGRPRFMRTDNEAVLVSHVFRWTCGCWASASNALSPGDPNETGEWNDSSGRSSGTCAGDANRQPRVRPQAVRHSAVVQPRPYP